MSRDPRNSQYISDIAYNDADECIWRGKAYAKKGDYQQAVKHLTRAIELEEVHDPSVFHTLGDSLQELGRYEEAISAYKESHRIVFDDHEAQCKIGLCNIRICDYISAIRFLDFAIHLQPGFAKALFLRSIANANLGKYIPAFEDCYNAIHIDNVQRTESYHHKIQLNDNIESEAKKLLPVLYSAVEESIENHSDTIINNPKDTNAYIERSKAYSALGKHKQAIADCSIAIHLNPCPDYFSVREFLYKKLADMKNSDADCKIDTDDTYVPF